MAENEGAGGGESMRDVALATMLQVYFEALRREPCPDGWSRRCGSWRPHGERGHYAGKAAAIACSDARGCVPRSER